MLTSDADTISRLTASRWNALTSNGTGSLQAESSGFSVRFLAPPNVSGRFVPGSTVEPEPETPTKAAENAAGASPRMFVNFTRND